MEESGWAYKGIKTEYIYSCTESHEKTNGRLQMVITLTLLGQKFL